jgi:hypothetical protein
MEVKSASRPGGFTPRERDPGIHWIGGWMGPRAGLNTVVKRKIPSPRRESNSRTPIVQPVAQCYTDDKEDVDVTSLRNIFPIQCPPNEINVKRQCRNTANNDYIPASNLVKHYKKTCTCIKPYLGLVCPKTGRHLRHCQAVM